MHLDIQLTEAVNVKATKITAYRSRIINFVDTHNTSTSSSIAEQAFTYFDDGVLIIEDGKIKALDSAKNISDQGFDLTHCEHLPDQLICPGFIDAHVHAPQLDVMGSYGAQLLDWLNTYTFPAEQQFACEEFSKQESSRFLTSLLANGTTSGLIFTTSYKHSTDHLFAEAKRLNMRIIAGKVMMDRNAPDALLDTAASSLADTEILINSWHNNGRLGYAVTPRFAGTSTIEQLTAAGKLVEQHPDVWMHTHLSENQNEIEWTKGLFPDAKNYLDVYDTYNLVGPRSIFAHCIHLDNDELSRFSDAGCTAAFCPSSNLFLGSGLFDLAEFKSRNIPVAMASDVGAGTSLSMLKTMGDAYKTCQLRSYPLSAIESFYLSTLGAARALQLDTYIGSLCPNKEADFIVLNPSNNMAIKARLKRCKTIEEELFVYMTMGDERLINQTYIAGELKYTNPLSTMEHTN